MEYPLPDWYGPFGSLSPSRWQGTGLSQSGLSAIQCGTIEGTCGRASANQRLPRHWVRRVLSSATGDPYKLRCVSASGSVLEFLLLWTLQTGAVGGTPTA